MRKKLFAILMSIAMLVTFMPAMAFAGATTFDNVPVAAEDVFTITNAPQYASVVEVEDSYSTKAIRETNKVTMVYDGQTSVVTYIPVAKAPTTWTWWNNYDILSSKVTYVVRDANAGKSIKTVAPAAPEFKDAGNYDVYATTVYTVQNYAGFVFNVEDTCVLHLTIEKRQVLATAAKNVTLTKDYNGKGFTLDDAFFQISPVAAPTNASSSLTKWFAENTGLVAGEKLIVKTYTTPADVDTYRIDWANIQTNPNYAVNPQPVYYVDPFTWTIKTCKYEKGLEKNITQVTIVKADNAVKIASNTLNIKRGSSKAVKFSATFGTAKLTKLSGNTKISVKNGKIVVKANCKKGTYKVKVKASVAGTKNWAKASRVKTLTIKVK